MNITPDALRFTRVEGLINHWVPLVPCIWCDIRSKKTWVKLQKQEEIRESTPAKLGLGFSSKSFMSMA